MKRLLFTFVILMFTVAVNAQEPEKKKESKSTPSSGTQERAINQSGVSVKTKSQTKSSSKTTSAPSSDDTKKEEPKHEEKKPQ